MGSMNRTRMAPTAQHSRVPLSARQHSVRSGSGIQAIIKTFRDEFAMW
jgi:hypothetical protein